MVLARSGRPETPIAPTAPTPLIMIGNPPPARTYSCGEKSAPGLKVRSGRFSSGTMR